MTIFQWDMTGCAVWHFRSLCLLGTEAQRLTPQTATGVTWPDVYDTPWQLAQPAAPLLEVVDGNSAIIYGAACPLPARVRLLCEWRPIPPVDV